MMVQVYNPITREAEAKGLLEVLRQPGLPSKPSFKVKKKIFNNGRT